MLPFAMPCLILGRYMHLYTFMIWGFFRLVNTIYLHSGYDFPWFTNDLCLFYANSAYHDYHHSHNIGNYAGMLTIWDSLIGANQNYYEYINDHKAKAKEE